jgi:hypothetical protein
VSIFKPHDRDTEMLMSCDPYLEDDIVYTVVVVKKPEPVIILENIETSSGSTTL